MRFVIRMASQMFMTQKSVQNSAVGVYARESIIHASSRTRDAYLCFSFTRLPRFFVIIIMIKTSTCRQTSAVLVRFLIQFNSIQTVYFPRIIINSTAKKEKQYRGRTAHKP